LENQIKNEKHKSAKGVPFSLRFVLSCGLIESKLGSSPFLCIQAEIGCSLKVLQNSMQKLNTQKCQNCLFSGCVAFCAQLGHC
jgi:hypothetical protein